MQRLRAFRIALSLVALVLAGLAAAPAGAADPCRSLPRLGDQPAGCATGGTVYTDPRQLVLLLYPSGWFATRDASIDASVLELDGPDGTFFFLDLYDPQTGVSPADEVQDIRTVHAKSARFTYVDGPVSDTRVGGEPAKTFTFTYTRKGVPGATPRDGQLWDVNHNGKEYLLTANIGVGHAAEIAAIVASIVFRS